MLRVTAQLRHQRRRAGDDIQLAHLMRGGPELAQELRQVHKRKFRDGEVVSLAKQLRHQRRRAGEDLQLGLVIPDQRLLRIRRRGGPSITLDQRLLRLRKEQSGGVTRLARLFPRSHVLVKKAGNVVTMSWICTNRGDGAGLGSVTLVDFTDGKQVAWNRDVRIPAGTSVPISFSWTIPAGFSGNHDMDLQMVDATTQNLRTLGSHKWTLRGN